MNSTFLSTARLLTQVAPLVFVDDMFALKGGTAINFFIRDLPRLSVDLDLVFTDHRLPRANALDRINHAVHAMGDRLRARGFAAQSLRTNDGNTKLIVRRDSTEVKVEVNCVLRGTVHPVRRAALTARASDLLKADLELPVLSIEDVYGGKLVAAMDRQHPRDLFDVMQLFEHEGISPAIRRAFVVYLASHHRPVHEVLFPAERNILFDYEHHFVGMTVAPVALTDLQDARSRMMRELAGGLDGDERAFLQSLVENRPDWDRLGIAHIAELLAIRWKLQNLQTLQEQHPAKLAAQSAALQRGFEASV